MSQTPSASTLLSEPEFQYSLFDDAKREPVINVASVPQRSPFRYPGGKTWLVPRIRKWIASLPQKPRELVEPFAGGGTVSLAVAFEGLTQQVTMVEMDAQVAAVWRTILCGDAQWLAEKIVEFDLTPESARRELANPCADVREQAFQTILRNRINHGGILAPGSGTIKHGENGKGIASRWYPQTLKKRILDIITVARRITFLQGDGLQVLRDKAACADVIHFIDPPYTAAGKRAGTRLYAHNELDHEELFRIAATLRGDFLMTYDNADGVKDLAKKHGFQTLAIPMKNTHHATMAELLIGRDLSWA